MKKFLFICDPLHLFKIQTDTTYSLMVSANYLGHEVYYCLPHMVYAENNVAKAISIKLDIFATESEIPGTKLPWYQENITITTALAEFDAIQVRNDPPFNIEYYYLTQLLTLAEYNGAKVVNNSVSLRNFNEKLAILNFPQLITPTLVSKNENIILDFLDNHSECVIKPLDLMAGRGIFKLSSHDVNCTAIIEASTNYYTQNVMVQKFIPEVKFGDRRIFIINGEIISHCLHRIPQNNQIRANIAAGGRAEVHTLKDEDYLIAEPVAKWLKQHNIIFAGIDVIGNKLTEVNITSPTGTRQILSQIGINIPQLVINSILLS